MLALVATFPLKLHYRLKITASGAKVSRNTPLAIIFAARVIFKFRLVGFFKSLTVGELEF